MKLGHWAKELKGLESFCVSAYAEAFEVIPYTLAENAGLHPIQIITELKAKHANGETTAGINVRTVSNQILSLFNTSISTSFDLYPLL